MANFVPSIVDSYPASGSTGIPIGDKVTVTFDQEMDETSINSGTFILAAPDNGVFFGADLQPLQEPNLSPDDILSSPYYGGYVQGTVSFSRVDASGSVVSDSAVDYTGDGTLWRTVAIFTPSQPLSPNVKYTILLAGDEDPTNQFDSGVRTRTVYDAEEVAVTGTGGLSFTGGFTGDSSVTYHVEITGAGTTGVATYQWWRASDPLTVYDGITTTGDRELEDGVIVNFGADGTFVVGDQWKVVCVPYYLLPNTYRWEFFTGSGAVVTPPSESSASGITTLGSSTSGSTITFSVSEISPVGGEYGVAISTSAYTGEEIVVTFSDTYPIDGNTITDDSVLIESEPANGDDLTITAEGELDYTATIVNNNELHLTLDPGQLYNNNIVVITLDKDIADTQGNTLGSDYISYFSTPYTPLYSSLRRVQLDLGPLITDLREETIMFAILEASLYADAITFATTILNTNYFYHARREFVTCMAELTLVKALMGDASSSDKMYKKLGDLAISRDGAGSGLDNTRNRLEDCLGYWRIAVETGGNVAPDASVPPGTTVKGSTASDAISVSRSWEPTTRVGYRVPAANTNVSRTDSSARRRYRTFRRRSLWRRSDD
jgi:hypothetical protein